MPESTHRGTFGDAGKIVRILGVRGVPAAHGGFETFAEHLALFLAERGWQVTVYCQEDGAGTVFEDTWSGVRRVRIPVAPSGAAGTVLFDWKATVHAAKEAGEVLTLGYNTAVFSILLRMAGIRNVINMDGIEWQRQKWGPVAKSWFWLNEWAGCWLGNHLVADHPEIKRHLETRVHREKITMIPYGADAVASADAALLQAYGITAGYYAILIARAEPENSILEIVRAWSRQRRGVKLVVLGKYEDSREYQRIVRAAASDEVVFAGAVYDKSVVQALRFHARFYIHGHQVGGTNPSLVEALGAGNAILAHDNRFNRWVAGPEACYFADEDECALGVAELLGGSDAVERMGETSRQRHAEQFTWPAVLHHYELLMERIASAR
jgi:glycosyltransferase involved in cell wall biosynthesis